MCCGAGSKVDLPPRRAGRLKDTVCSCGGGRAARRGAEGASRGGAPAVEEDRLGVAAMAIRGFIRGSLLLPLKSLACCR